MKIHYYLITTILTVCVTSLNAQISNHGDLKIVSGTDVKFTDEYVNNGNHNSDGNLQLNNNFINNGSTVANSGTTFFKSATNNLIQISGTADTVNFYNLELDVTAANTKGVRVEDNRVLNLQNSLYLKNGDLRLMGESQLIQMHSGSNTNTFGAGKLLKDQQGESSVYKYNYWSSPVNRSAVFSIASCLFDGSDADLNPFSPQAINLNNGAPYNGLPSVTDVSGNVTNALTINKYWLYTYMFGNGSYADWLHIDENTTLNPGQGYTMKGTGTSSSYQNYVFYGEPNNGDYTFTINSGEHALLGNPYPSALDADQFLTDNASVVDALYFWVDGGSTSHYLTDYLGGYGVKNLTGGTPPSVASPLIYGIGTSGSVTSPTQYVSVGQGFFVQASSNGTIQFNNAQRAYKTESSTETTFYRLNSNTNDLNKYIRIGYENPGGFHRQLLLGFLPNSGANLDYNMGYDAEMFDLRDNDAYFIIEDNDDLQYVIQGVGEFATQMEFPLGIKISELGIHKITIDALENFNHSVYLRDTYTNTEIDLTASDYEFSLPIGVYNNRFVIAFEALDVLQVEDNSLKELQVFYNGLESIIVRNNKNIHIDCIEIYNTLGQLIIKKQDNLNNNSTITIPFAHPNGIYIVDVKSDNTQKSTKILKY
ncbi:T9SS type A sorting domain-containing protein [Winogradskyella sp.]|uniref:T9SS type A sorting domain-containing protein n=1 Tax=Winogradskyella sp. TaxID=1883156 RepID=UPI001B2B2D1F|nr:T9SS type A sorting domain-containing protein [Winogradskyella sp.]MBO6880953.1 T9SS type A sorting domain-containing protein [Winogradskyella sp.]